MDRVINFDFSQNLIKEVACLIEKDFIKKGKDLSRVAFVFGGKRPALFLKRELSLRIKKGFFPPRFFSMDEFIEYSLLKELDFSKIKDLDACFTIYNLAKRIAPGMLKGREDFSQFLGWAKETLDFIDQMDQEDIKISSLKDIQFNAQAGYDVPESINKLLESIISLRREYHSILSGKKEFSRGLIYLKASEHIAAANFDEFDIIIFCGFFYLSNAEARVVKVLYESKKAALIFQGDPREWVVLDNVYKNLGIDGGDRFGEKIVAGTNLSPQLSIYAGFDAHSQACLIREALKKIDNLDETVVVAPDAENLIPLLSEIASCVKDFNVSMGYPLNRSSVYSLFECIFNAQQTLAAGKYYAKDYLTCLGHPLIKNLKIFSDQSATRVMIHKIEEIMLGIEKTSLSGGLFVSPEQIENSGELYDLVLKAAGAMGIHTDSCELKGAINQLHHILFTQWEGVKNFYDFSEALKRLMDTLINKSFLSNYPLNLKMAEKIFSIREELANASFKKEDFPQEDIFKIFRSKLNAEKISFSGSPLSGLQILGLFETRSLNFENVLVMDVNEAVLPSLKICEPLIPREVMISLGLNRIENEEEVQRYHFKRLIASAKNVHLIYQDTPDKEKSRFVEELIWERQKESKSLDAVKIPRASFSVKVLPERLKIEKTGKVLEFLKGLEYSASSVNTYLRCPLKFYYQYVLGLKEKEELLDEPQGADIGVFIHELLEKTFAVFLGRKPLIDAKFKDMFFTALDKKFEYEFKRKLKSDSFLIKEILDVRLERFLANERKREVKEILSLEKTFKNRIKLASGEFNFKAIVDRVDSLEDGSALILDYKTGDSDIMPSSDSGKIKNALFSREACLAGRRAIKNTVKSFQLPLYFHMVKNDPGYEGFEINAALYMIKELDENLGLKKLFKERHSDKTGIMNLYMDALSAVMADLLNPKEPFKADESDALNCSWCEFFYMCR